MYKEYKMKIDKDTLELITKIERIIGSQCYNPNPHKGCKKKDEKCRYSVSYRKDSRDKTLYKSESGLEGFSKYQIQNAQYAFGYHNLLIGEAILKVLDELETRYNLDFNELEKERTKRRKSFMRQLKKELEKFSEAEIEAGRYECGVDIEEGKYTITSDENAVITIKRSGNSKRKDENFELESNSKRIIKLYDGDIFESDVMLLLKQ